MLEDHEIDMLMEALDTRAEKDLGEEIALTLVESIVDSAAKDNPEREADPEIKRKFAEQRLKMETATARRSEEATLLKAKLIRIKRDRQATRLFGGIENAPEQD